MRQFQAVRLLSTFARRESGVTLIETVVGLAVLGAIAVAFLCGLAIISKAAFMTDEQTTAESLVRSQMEWVKNIDYDSDPVYSPAPMPGGKDYDNYSVAIAAEPLHNPDDGIQKITVTVKHSDKEMIKLEGYKVDR